MTQKIPFIDNIAPKAEKIVSGTKVKEDQRLPFDNILKPSLDDPAVEKAPSKINPLNLMQGRARGKDGERIPLKAKPILNTKKIRQQAKENEAANAANAAKESEKILKAKPTASADGEVKDSLVEIDPVKLSQELSVKGTATATIPTKHKSEQAELPLEEPIGSKMAASEVNPIPTVKASDRPTFGAIEGKQIKRDGISAQPMPQSDKGAQLVDQKYPAREATVVEREQLSSNQFDKLSHKATAPAQNESQLSKTQVAQETVQSFKDASARVAPFVVQPKQAQAKEAPKMNASTPRSDALKSKPVVATRENQPIENLPAINRNSQAQNGNQILRTSDAIKQEKFATTPRENGAPAKVIESPHTAQKASSPMPGKEPKVVPRMSRPIETQVPKQNPISQIAKPLETRTEIPSETQTNRIAEARQPERVDPVKIDSKMEQLAGDEKIQSEKFRLHESANSEGLTKGERVREPSSRETVAAHVKSSPRVSETYKNVEPVTTSTNKAVNPVRNAISAEDVKKWAAETAVPQQEKPTESISTSAQASVEPSIAQVNPTKVDRTQAKSRTADRRIKKADSISPTQHLRSKRAAQMTEQYGVDTHSEKQNQDIEENPADILKQQLRDRIEILKKAQSAMPLTNEQLSNQNLHGNMSMKATPETNLIQGNMSSIPHPRANAPLFARSFAAEMVEKIRVMGEQQVSGGNQSKTTFVVDGGPMGEMDIEFHQEASREQITIFVDSENTKSELQRVLPNIEENMNQRGFSFSGVEVEVKHDHRNSQSMSDGSHKNSLEDQEKTAPQEQVVSEDNQQTTKRNYGYNTMEVLA